MPAYTTMEFITKARAAHPLAGYDYSKVRYVTAHTKVTIACPVQDHGDFEQRAYSHLQGQGCPKCGGTARSTLAGFIERATRRHPDANYGYDKVAYVNDTTKVTITCPVQDHGDFEQVPSSHLQGQGCPKCGSERSIASRTMTRDDFIAKARVRHPFAGYGYDKFVYVNSRVAGTITCPVPGHGDFEQEPCSHLQGRGCVTCGRERIRAALTSTVDEFVVKAKARHPLAGYGYDKVAYVGKGTRVTITCPTHGDFRQTPHEHLAGNGCQKCAGSVSRVCTAWLDDLGVTVREHRIRVPGRRFPVFVDGYDPKANTAYEFLGDYFHGNPAIYDPGEWDSAAQRRTYGQKHARLMRKLDELRAAGYNVITMWERDFRVLNKERMYPHTQLRTPRGGRSKPPGRPPRPPRNSQPDLFG